MCILIFIISQLTVVWIVKLGPPNYGDDKLYSYIIILVPGKQLYFVRARNLGEFKDNYDNGVKQWLKENGFSDPVATPQPENCVYEEQP